MLVEAIQIPGTLGRDKLIVDFLAEDPGLFPFISAFPSIENIVHQVESKSKHAVDRDLLVDILIQQNEGIKLSESSAKNIESLRDSNTFTITTGHQLCLFTGPAYFIYKIVSAISLANKLNSSHPRKKFVPVFWMASEDHDAEEISSTQVRGKKLEWQAGQNGAVGTFMTSEMEKVIEEFAALTGNNDLVMGWIREAYNGKNKLSEATRILVNHLFGKFGLVIIDGNDRRFKKSFSNVIREELKNQVSEPLVSASSAELESAGYKAVLNARPINLFLLGSGSRERITKNGDSWNTVNDTVTFSDKELDQLIAESPELFSPNVVLRPLYQEWILPNIVYIGGPAEVAYWCQLKKIFEHFKVPFPVLVLRDSAVVIAPKIRERIQKLGINYPSLFSEYDALVKMLIQDKLVGLNDEKNELESLFIGITNKAAAIDPTLSGFVKAEMQRQLTALENIEKKMLKAIKQNEDIKLTQFDKVYSQLFPGGEWQERSENGLAFVAEFGTAMIDDLVRSFDPLSNTIKVILPTSQGNTGE